MIDKYEVLRNMPIKHEGGYSYEDITENMDKSKFKYEDLFDKEMELVILHLLDKGWLYKFENESAEQLCDFQYNITPLGLSEFNTYEYGLKLHKKEKRNNWIRYWITTSIAVAALIMSVIAIARING